MNMNPAPYLDDLEHRIDDEIETGLMNRWIAFADGRHTGGVFSPSRGVKNTPRIAWPDISINQALSGMDNMIVHQLAACSSQLQNGGGDILNVRANYGTGILPSVFGAELFMMDEELNTLPTTKPVEGGRDAMRKLVDRGLPDIRTGLGAAVFDTGRRFTEMFSAYPNISRHVHIYHPDMQSPMDVCELLWGSSIFLDVYDVPELVKELLELITEVYHRFMCEWLRLVPPRVPLGEGTNHGVHWLLVHRGRIMLRDDSAMNFSPEMYEEFILPYDSRLLEEFGGGAIHFCGRGDHYIAAAARIPRLYAVNMSQPEYNDMETIYRNTVDKGIQLVGLDRATAARAVAGGRNLHGNVHCW